MRKRLVKIQQQTLAFNFSDDTEALVATLPPPDEDEDEEEMLERAIAMSLEEQK